ncbi:uncharacterized protein CTRU02_210168 [Colletotrichum truncatum]|uniref:Uncharacterized protein n=1 Tax=Colletotrichum truncatum TaxID=5467 RepID=A0ACC3YUN0_COLTU|nr:uncharacterized protein CTRU02_15598 [Colletotrichum truncatum]KAF6780892.1 hypothetical protein CTRU02_15598 [Colletotrichum truncatum]
MRSITFVLASLVSAAAADFTMYCCAGGNTRITTGDIAWALDAKNGRINEMGIAGGATYHTTLGMCKFGNQPMACGKYVTSARTRDRASTKLKNGRLSCEDPAYLEVDQWHCPF